MEKVAYNQTQQAVQDLAADHLACPERERVACIHVRVPHVGYS